jgi:DNA-binding CsgD family transcriptional regulator
VFGVRLIDDSDTSSLRPIALLTGARGLRVLSELARAGGECEDRHRFRHEALGALRRAIPFDFGFVATPAMQHEEPVAVGAIAGLTRLLTRHARASWIELRGLRGRAEDGVLQLLTEIASSPMLRLLQLDRRVTALCIGWLSDDSAAVVLGREMDPGFRQPELELLRLALPVFSLADAQAADLADSLGARLSPREEEIFSYLQRGYSNRQIALVLGTSPLTVRNQLARLFRKVGVSSRAELVGLATPSLRASGR